MTASQLEATVSAISTRVVRLVLALAGTALVLAVWAFHKGVPEASAAAPMQATPLPYHIYLPVVSATYPSPFPAKPPAGSSGLAFVNYYRSTARLPDVTDEPVWSSGAQLHARYSVKNDVLLHTEDPANPWFTAAGAAAAAASNQIGSWNVTASDEWAVDTWMTAVFHAVGMLDPSLRQVGYGAYRESDGGLQMAAALDVIRGMGSVPAGVSFPIKWPGDGMTVPLKQHDVETPSPLTSCPGYATPSGLPVLLMFGGGDPAPLVTGHSFYHGGVSLEHCVFDGTTYVNPDANQQALGRAILRARNAITLVPRAPLTPGANYTASITVNGVAHQWTFSVAPTAALAAAGAPAPSPAITWPAVAGDGRPRLRPMSGGGQVVQSDSALP
jgi:uncharacterized protein YkwD